MNPSSPLNKQLNDLTLNNYLHLEYCVSLCPTLALPPTNPPWKNIHELPLMAPSPLPNPDPSKSSSSSSIRFHLRSRDVLVLMNPKSLIRGLGTNPTFPFKGRGRGRPSHLSMVQNKALRDQANGRKQTIFGELRVVQAPDGAPK